MLTNLTNSEQMKTPMKILKPLVVLVLLFNMASLAHAQEQSTLVVWHADGTQTRIALYKKPQVTLDGQTVSFKSPVLNLQYPASDVLKFTYEGTPATSVTSPQEETSYSCEGESIYFDPSVTADKVILYTSGGVRVPVQFQQTERGLSLSLSSIPSGVYLLSVDGKTSKFVKP
jgi:hypothetical protein